MKTNSFEELNSVESAIKEYIDSKNTVSLESNENAKEQLNQLNDNLFGALRKLNEARALVNGNDGKITYIDNGSGHYKPGFDQLKLAVKHLHKQGVLAKEVEVHDFEHNTKCNLETILSQNVEIDVPELFDMPNDHYNSSDYHDVLNTGDNIDFN